MKFPLVAVHIPPFSQPLPFFVIFFCHLFYFHPLKPKKFDCGGLLSTPLGTTSSANHQGRKFPFSRYRGDLLHEGDRARWEFVCLLVFIYLHLKRVCFYLWCRCHWGCAGREGLPQGWAGQRKLRRSSQVTPGLLSSGASCASAHQAPSVHIRVPQMHIRLGSYFFWNKFFNCHSS
jgi:hypothetical protein